METLFLLKDPATLAEFNLLGHAAEMFRVIDSEQRRFSLKGIKLTVTAFCEPKIQVGNKSPWKTLRLTVRLLHAHNTKTHINLWVTVDRTTKITTVNYGADDSFSYTKQTGRYKSFQKIAYSIVCRLVQRQSLE